MYLLFGNLVLPSLNIAIFSSSVLFCFCFVMFIYFWERERDRVQFGEGQRGREGDTESEAGSRLWAVSTEPNAGLKPTNCEIMTWAKLGANQLSHPGAHSFSMFIILAWWSTHKILISTRKITLLTYLHWLWSFINSSFPIYYKLCSRIGIEDAQMNNLCDTNSNRACFCFLLLLTYYGF